MGKDCNFHFPAGMGKGPTPKVPLGPGWKISGYSQDPVELQLVKDPFSTAIPLIPFFFSHLELSKAYPTTTTNPKKGIGWREIAVISGRSFLRQRLEKPRTQGSPRAKASCGFPPLLEPFTLEKGKGRPRVLHRQRSSKGSGKTGQDGGDEKCFPNKALLRGGDLEPGLGKGSGKMV